MSFVANRIALGIQPRLESRHVTWDPGRIDHVRLRGLYVTATAAAYVERRAAEEDREGKKAVETAEVLHSGRGGGREGSVTDPKSNEVQGQLRGIAVAEGGKEGGQSMVGVGRLGTQGTDEDRRGGVTHGSHPDGDRSNHTTGHTSVAEGDGCAKPYLEAPVSCCGGSGHRS